MSQDPQIVALVGSYHRNGVVAAAVAEVLAAAVAQGAGVERIHLADHRIEFCTNCRTCMQSPGPARGRCVLDDDLEGVLGRLERARSLVIGAPVNMGNVNALTRRFMERCAGYGYWPWGAPMPRLRDPRPVRRAVLVCASGAPAWLARPLTGAGGALRMLAKLLGAKPIGTLWIGGVSEQGASLPPRVHRRAVTLAARLLAA